MLLSLGRIGRKKRRRKAPRYPRKRLRLTRRGIEHAHEHEEEHEQEQEQEQEGPNVSRTAHHPLSGKRERLPDNGISDGRSILRHALRSVLRAPCFVMTR